MTKSAKDLKAEVVKYIQNALTPFLGEAVTPTALAQVKEYAVKALQRIGVNTLDVNLEVDSKDPSLVHITFSPIMPTLWYGNHGKATQWYNGATGQMEDFEEFSSEDENE